LLSGSALQYLLNYQSRLQFHPSLLAVRGPFSVFLLLRMGMVSDEP
jgi:hypothetical protein